MINWPTCHQHYWPAAVMAYISHAQPTATHARPSLLAAEASPRTEAIYPSLTTQTVASEHTELMYVTDWTDSRSRFGPLEDIARIAAFTEGLSQILLSRAAKKSAHPRTPPLRREVGRVPCRHLLQAWRRVRLGEQLSRVASVAIQRVDGRRSALLHLLSTFRLRGACCHRG